MALDTFNPYLFVSSGEQSNKFLTPTYADGIAKFQAQRAQELTGLTVRIDPIQEGSGDPSPTNIRPISGRTGVTVTRAGKNLLDVSNIVTSAYNIGGIPNNLKPNTTYNYSINGTTTMRYRLFLAKSSNPLDAVQILSQSYLSGGQNQSFTTPSDMSGFDMLCLAGTNGAGSVPIEQILPQIEAGSAHSSYEPYQGTTYPVAWESIAGTVYGGTLDVVSGVLTVTHGYILLDGSQAIRTNGRTAVTQRAFISIDGKAVGTANMQSDRFFVTSSGDVVGKMNGRVTSNGVEFYLPLDGTADTDASCKQWFADNNTQLVYELATPQTYRLTGAEARTIAGFNQIYSDAGPIIDIKF